jgi:ABC-type Na+ efflux pump permease subunit
MKAVILVLRKEWSAFLGSERGVFVVYAFLILSWSCLPLSAGLGAGPVWWLFFSIIISGNFSNTVFVAERLSGSMEILLTCGLTREAVLLGKAAFVMLMSCAVGAACLGLAVLWLSLTGKSATDDPQRLQALLLYLAGTLMNIGCAAWLSVRLQSPRIIPILSIGIAALIVAPYLILAYAVGAPQWILPAILLAAAAIFFFYALREFRGEKVVTPITL